MKKETLKHLRLVIPGILFYLMFLPLAQGSVDLAGLIAIDTKNVILALIVIVFGALYRTLHLRDYAFREPIETIQNNIKDRLLALAPEWLPISELKAIEAKKFMKIFYHFVDNDKSLTEKSADIYENGLLLSTFSDLVVIGFFASPIYLIAHYAHAFKDYVVMSLFLLGLICISLALLHKAKRNHIKLSDDQLEHLLFIYRDKVPDQLAALAKSEKK